MKAIVLVAGVGSKLLQPSHIQPKTLLPLAEKPILGHIIDDFLKAGVDDFVFVIGALGYRIQQFVHLHYHKKIRYEFVVQEPRLGSAHAVWTARHTFEKEQELLIVFGDALSSINGKKFVNSKLSAVGITKVDNPSSFGIVEVDKENFVRKMTEKPKIPKSNWALVGLYKIMNVPLLLRTIEGHIQQQKTVQGEYLLTNALAEMLSHGESFAAVEVNHWYDCSKKNTLLEANEMLLKRDEFMTVDTSRFHNCIFIPPVSLSKNCVIQNSIIGPNVTVGNGAVIDTCILRDSIVGTNGQVHNAVLRRTIVGNDASVRGAYRTLNVSDEAAVDMQGSM
jgi:glucose-1-phosphate thymidylyltransferase